MWNMETHSGSGSGSRLGDTWCIQTPPLSVSPPFPSPSWDHTLQAQTFLRERALISPGTLHLCVQGPTPGRLYTISFQLNQEGSMSLYECFHFGSVGQKGDGNKQLIKLKQTGLFITPLTPFHALLGSLRGMCVAVVFVFQLSLNGSQPTREKGHAINKRGYCMNVLLPYFRQEWFNI